MQKNQSGLWWIDETHAKIFNAHIQKHIISLCITYLIKRTPTPKACWISGFLIQTKGLLIWITAGHVLKKLDKLLQSNEVSDIKTRWIDNYPNNEANFIPCDLADITRTAVDIEGYDFGIVILRWNYSSLILKNGKIQPLTEVHWMFNDVFKAEGYYLVGFPKEFTDLKQTNESAEKVEFRSSATCISIPLRKEERTIHQSEDVFWQHENNFYWQVVFPIRNDDGTLLTDISGMSSGPIFGVHSISENKFEYRIIALQSSWLESKFTRGTRFDKIIEILNRAIETAISSNQT